MPKSHWPHSLVELAAVCPQAAECPPDELLWAPASIVHEGQVHTQDGARWQQPRLDVARVRCSRLQAQGGGVG
jgi:hypothetical protein